jgi:HEAT repeat protein
MRRALVLASGLVALAANVPAQDDARGRVRAVRELAKQGEDAIPKITPYVRDPDSEVRVEAVKALNDIGGPKTLDGLAAGARDADPEVQIRATDGIVNIYLPGYLKTGFAGSVRRVGTAVRGKFTDTNDQVVESFVTVRPEAVEALAVVAHGSTSFEGRANAARALGILRGRYAVPELMEALRSKDGRLMYEALIALQKIGDPSVAPRITFLLRDLDEKVQITALETTGLLRNRDAAPEVRDALDHARNDKIRRAALGALAILADPADHARFVAGLAEKDEGVRGAAAEGLGRLKNPMDRALLDKALAAERSTNPRLSICFALVSLGNSETADLSPFRYLVNTLNQRSYRGVALAFLIELAREERVRQPLYTMLGRATPEEKIGLASVFGRSGEKDSVPYLETLSMDANPDVAAEGVRSLRTLRARLP